MRICKHIEAFRIEVSVTDSSRSALPPWMAVCEDCAATVFEALEAQQGAIAARRPSGKSGSASKWARTRRLLGWLRGSDDTGG